MPTNKNEVHVYTKYNHSLAVQNNEISNKTLKKWLSWFLQKQFMDTQTELFIWLLATIKYRMKKINYIPDISVLFNHHKSLIQRCKINYVY